MGKVHGGADHAGCLRRHRPRHLLASSRFSAGPWSLWLAARWLFKARFGYLKALEVAGLSSSHHSHALGMVIATLLAVILGRLYAGPSLALLVERL